MPYPLYDNARHLLLAREGQGFVVRMFSGKCPYAFTNSIFKVASTPFPHLHLIYPKQVRGLVVRRGARPGRPDCRSHRQGRSVTGGRASMT